MPSASEYQQRAFAHVGLSASDAERMRGEHECQLLDIDERRGLMRRIAAAYATLYLEAPDAFLWMGFAAIALHDGVRPSSELAARAAQAPWLRALDRGPLGRVLGWLLGATPAASANDGAQAAFEANFAICADLFWVHLAYVDGGLVTLRALHRAGEISTALLEGFVLIERGRGAGRRGYRWIVDGNRLLFRHEQRGAVTPVFAKYAHAMRVATRLGLIAVPNQRLRRSCAELGRSPEWSDAPHAADSYGPFATRWRWLLAAAWEPFVELHRKDRADLHREIWRAVTDVPEGMRN